MIGTYCNITHLQEYSNRWSDLLQIASRYPPHDAEIEETPRLWTLDPPINPRWKCKKGHSWRNQLAASSDNQLHFEIIRRFFLRGSKYCLRPFGLEHSEQYMFEQFVSSNQSTHVIGSPPKQMNRMNSDLCSSPTITASTCNLRFSEALTLGAVVVGVVQSKMWKGHEKVGRSL